MHRGNFQRGYTILEVMIFLTISTVLFITIALTISGQQRKSEFAQSVREIDSKLQDILNDVSTGYYADSGTFNCSVTGGVPTVTAGANTKGSNADCTFIGRVLQFAPNGGNYESIDIINVAGLRYKVATTTDVTNLTDAKPTPISYGQENILLQANAKIRAVKYDNGSGLISVGAVGIFTDFSAYSGTSLVSGSRTASIIPISSTILNDTNANTFTFISNNSATSTVNPSNGVTICLDSSSGNQHATIIIGGSNRKLTTYTTIIDGYCT